MPVYRYSSEELDIKIGREREHENCVDTIHRSILVFDWPQDTKNQKRHGTKEAIRWGIKAENEIVSIKSNKVADILDQFDFCERFYRQITEYKP